MKDFEEAVRRYDDSRIEYALARELMGGKSFGKNILDVGAGKGEFTDMLKKQGYQVSCVERAPHLYAELLQKGYQVAQVDLEEERLPFPDHYFDLIVSLEVIEHIWNTRHYVRELRRVVRPDGYIILTTPNYNYWSFRILALIGLAERFLTQDYHKKLFTAHSLFEHLDPFFEVEKVKGRGMVPKTSMHYPVPFLLNLLAMHVGVLCKPHVIKEMP